MIWKRTLVILFCISLLFLAVSSVNASDENVTDEITIEDSDDVILDDSNIQQIVNKDDIYEDNLSDEGEFINVDDAYMYLNAFRTENGVWQWNEDDTTKTIFNTNDTNRIKPLIRDSDLEETAKIRAKELVVSFSHTRPDGTQCFTAFPDDLSYCGENIAYGQISCEDVTEAWKETNDNYDGQGHRRNMLLRFCQ